MTRWPVYLIEVFYTCTTTSPISCQKTEQRTAYYVSRASPFASTAALRKAGAAGSTSLPPLTQ